MKGRDVMIKGASAATKAAEVPAAGAAADDKVGRGEQGQSQAAAPDWPIFSWADQAEILRASQKDEYYVKQLHAMAADAIEHTVGGRFLSRFAALTLPCTSHAVPMEGRRCVMQAPGLI